MQETPLSSMPTTMTKVVAAAAKAPKGIVL